MKRLSQISYRVLAGSFALLFLIVSATTWLADRSDLRLTADALAEEERQHLSIYAEILSRHFEAAVGHVRVLSRSVPLVEFLEIRDEVSAQRLGEEFQAVADGTMLFDQVRLIGDDGIELVRVNWSDGIGRIVPANELQDKSDRYYFQESIEMEPNSIYVSRFDLNIENSEIEIPFKPVIRIAMPIELGNGSSRSGVLLFNYLGQHLLDELGVASENKTGSIMLLNDDGYWLYADDSELRWGFMFPEKAGNRFDLHYPTVWDAIRENNSELRIDSDSGVFLVKKYYPLVHLELEFNVPESGLANKGPNWWLVSHFDRAAIASVVAPHRDRRLSIYIASLILSMFVSLIVSYTTTKSRRYRLELEKAALYDGLTGLPNRALFFDRIAMHQAEAGRNGSLFVIMFIDLDWFKEVNDTHGHDAGDELLIQAADRLRFVLRKTDTIARMGGDEFIVLISECPTESNARFTAEKLRAELSSPFMLKRATVTIGASVGAYIMNPGQMVEPDDLLRRADEAMYEAKRSGKGDIRLYRAESGGPNESNVTID